MSTQALKFLISADDKASATFKRLQAEVGGLQATGARLGAVFGSLGPTLAAGLSVGALVAFGRATVNGIDALNDLKDATGASIENLSALEDIAVRTGTGVESAWQAVIKLNQALNAASDPNSDAAAAFRALGLSVEELKRIDPVQALQRVGVALAGFADDGNKGRLTLELLGKSTAQLAPLLKDLAAAGQLQATVSTEQAEAAEALNKQFFALQKNTTDAARRLVSDLVPALNDVLAAFNQGGLVAALDQVGEKIGLGRAYYGARNLRILGDEIAALEARLSGSAFLLAGGNPAEREVLAAKKRQYDQLAQSLRVTEAAQRALADASNPANYGNEGRRGALPSLPAVLNPKRPPGGKAAADRRFDSGTGADEATIAALKAIEQTDVAKLGAVTAAYDKLINLRASGLGGDAALDQAIQNLRDEIEKLDPALRQAAEGKRRLDQILGQTPTAIFDAALKDIGLLNDAFDRGKISAEQWAEAVLEVKKAIEKSGDETKAVGKDVADELGLVFASAAGQAITQFKDLRSVLKGVLADVLQIVVKSAITDPLSSMISGGLKGFDLPSLLLSVFGGGLASGGPVQAGRMYRVNELGGPGELLNVGGQQYLMATRNGSVSPNAGMAITSAPTIYIDSRSDRAEVAQLVARGVQAGNQQLLAGLRASGALA